MNLRVKIKRVKDVELPKYAKPGDSGIEAVEKAIKKYRGETE